MRRRIGDTPLGWEDYVLLPNDGRRHEIIEGDWHVTPAPTAKHQWVSRNFETLLHGHAKAQELGAVLHAPIDVILDEHDIVQPDIIFVARARLAIIGERVEGAPDLVIEILSPATAAIDRGQKSRVYARAGVAHYWLVDPAAETLDEYRLEAGAYELVKRWEGAATVRPAAFPGLEFALPELWKL